MVSKKKAAAKKNAKKKHRDVGKPASPEAPRTRTRRVRIDVPAPEFRFGSGRKIFPDDRPVAGFDIERLKDETSFDLNTIEASVGISRREHYYELRDQVGDKHLPDIAMAILVRLYEAFPKQLLPFQPMEWAAYLQIIGVHPSEFAQIVGRNFNAGRSWQEGGKPSRPVQLILEAFRRAGVTSTKHPVYREFLIQADRELRLRSKIWLNSNQPDDVTVRTAVFESLGSDDGAVALYKFNDQGSIVGIPERMMANKPGLTKEAAIASIVEKVIDGLAIKKAPKAKRKRRQSKELIEAEDSMLQPVED